MHPGRRIRLSVGLSVPMQVAATFILLIMIGVISLVALAGFSFGPLASMFTNPTPQAPSLVLPTEALNHPLPQLPNVDIPGAVDTVGKVVGSIALAMGVLFLYLLLYLWRSGIWLEGTLVTRRGVLLSRRADLSTAVIRMGNQNYTTVHQSAMYRTYTTYRVQALVISAPRGAGKFKVPLRGRGLDLLPDWQLAALGAAVATNRGPDPARAHAIATYLYDLSRDPLVS